MTDRLDETQKLAREAVAHLEQGQPEKAASWLADAGASLRAWLEDSGRRDVAGLDAPTIRGALLPGFEAQPASDPDAD
jgi:hypothetical protein